MQPLSLDMQNPTQQTTQMTLSGESPDILQRLKNISTDMFFKPDPILVNKLNDIQTIDLSNILKRLFAEMVQEDHMIDPLKFLDRLSSVIPFTKLQEAVQDDVGDVLKEAKAMFEEAQLYLQMTSGKVSPSIRTCLSSVLEGIISIIESFITAFGVGEFFKPSESDIHADFKSQKIMVLLSLFSMFTTMILPILGAETGGLLIGGIILGFSALSVIWPLIKPMPTYLPANAENWTKQVQNGGFVAQGRRESLDEIANILKMNRHAILVGPSRVGKSLTAKAFAQAIERGDYPELKGKVVFRINTTDLLDQKSSFLGGGNTILNKISAAMGRHRNDIIIVFDEIHMACKNNEKISDQLKTFLDENGEFPHVIGITTEEEYHAHVKDNNAFSLRFDRVDIKNTNEEETLGVLSETLIRSPSKPLLQDGALDYIYKKSCQNPDAPQPTASLKLLKRCMNRTGKTQKSPTEKKMIEITNKILTIRKQSGAYRKRKKDLRLKISQLEEQLSKLQKTLSESQEKIKLDKLFKTKELFDRMTLETYATVIKISGIAQATLNSKTENQLKLFILLSEFFSRSLESHIQNMAESFGVKAIIDEALIDEVAATA